MRLTVEDLTGAILGARSIERLQCELREAMIQQLIEQSSSLVPADTVLTGAPNA